MSWWEEEEEQIWDCGGSDSVWERLSNQPIYSPPQSPTSVFLISPQLYFSQPPPLRPQLQFSPPPTTSVFMFPCLDFSPLPSSTPILTITDIGQIELTGITIWGSRNIRFISIKDWASPHNISFISIKDREVAIYGCHYIEKLDLRLRSNPNTQHARSSTRLIESIDIKERRQCHSSKPLKRNLEDFERGFGSALEVVLKFIDEFPCLRRLKLINAENPKMVSMWSCLSVVKMTLLLSCSGEFISRDCSLVEERLVDITVEVDATNNGAHGVKAYENFSIVSHSEKKNTGDKFKRNYKSISLLTREYLQQHFGSRREDVAKSFGVSVSTLKRICRQHGISRWPFQPERKKDRLMEVISPSMHEKHDSRLRCIRTPLHARSSPRTIALLDGGEMVQLDSSKQQSLVEFDVTNNSAHLVKASQSCFTISHSDETNSRETLKRKCTTESVLSFEDLQQHFGCKLDDAAKALGVSVSTVKRICRKHGIPRWPSQKKRKVSKTDCILLEPQGEKDVSPTCNKMPTDEQTEGGDEMVGHLQDQNEGPNLSNTENGSNEESITTLIFQDSVPVFEMDSIFLQAEGEKNVSPTCRTPTTGQTEVGNEMVGHIQDQNGIVSEFTEGSNLSNIENCSNEKSLTTPNFQDSVPGNYPTMDFSISSTYRESGEELTLQPNWHLPTEKGGSSELAFQSKELTPLMAYPNPNAYVFTQPHVSLREMLIENVESSKDSRNIYTSAVGAFIGGHVSEFSRTVDLCSDPAPMQTMTTIPHTMPHLTEKQDIRTVTFKAQYGDDTIKFRLSLPSGIVELKKEVTNRLGELGSFKVHYQDNDNEWILIGCDTDIWDCFELSSSSGNEVVRLLVRD